MLSPAVVKAFIPGIGHRIDSLHLEDNRAYSVIAGYDNHTSRIGQDL